MSAPASISQVLFQQRVLACGGFYKDKLDGLWGKNTEAAAKQAEQMYLSIRQNEGEFDARSEKAIATLLPKMQEKARLILKAAHVWSGRRSLSFAVLSGTRSYPEQDALYAQGRSTKGSIVTNARGGSSNHNFAIALDIGIFDMKGRYFTGSAPRNASAAAKQQARMEEKAYADLGRAVKETVPGIDWGGDWKFVDAPHYEYATGLTIAQKRTKFEAGKLFL